MKYKSTWVRCQLQKKILNTIKICILVLQPKLGNPAQKIFAKMQSKHHCMQTSCNNQYTCSTINIDSETPLAISFISSRIFSYSFTRTGNSLRRLRRFLYSGTSVMRPPVVLSSFSSSLNDMFTAVQSKLLIKRERMRVKIIA